jgi:integrase
VRRSTKTTDETLAKKIAMEWAQLAQAGREKRLTESQCRQVIADLYERTIGEPLHFRTARGYLLEWLEDQKPNLELRSYWRYEQTIQEFLDHLGRVKSERLLREITPKDIRSWRDALKTKGLSAPTVNGHLKVMRMPFKAAHDNGYIDLNPCTKNSVRLLKDDAENVTKDVFTPKQIRALIEAAPSEDWKGMILLGFFSGLRLRDCAELRWNNLDLEKHIITVKTRKTGKTVIIPIHPQCTAWLLNQTRGIGKAPVFPSLAGKSGSGKSGLSSQFGRIMERAGIEGRLLRHGTGAGRSYSSLSFHSLRHSFNSGLANAGVGVELRQELVGHASADMNKTYLHPDVEVMREAVLKLPVIPQQKLRVR